MKQKSEAKIRRLRTRWLHTAALVIVILLAGRWSAAAEDYRGTEEQRTACLGDVFRFCFSEIPNVSRIVGCVAREKQQLSAGCRAVFDHHSNVRVAHATSWRKLRHSASGHDQPALLARERREVATAPSSVPMSTRVATAENAHTCAMHQADHARAKVASRSNARSKLALRVVRARRHKVALAGGKQYRRRYHVHQG